MPARQTPTREKRLAIQRRLGQTAIGRLVRKKRPHRTNCGWDWDGNALLLGPREGVRVSVERVDFAPERR